MGVQPLSSAQVGEVLVVSPDEEWMLSSLQPVSPLVQRQDHGQQFPVSHVVISLRQ